VNKKEFLKMINTRRKKDNGKFDMSAHSRVAYLVGESNEEEFYKRINYEKLNLSKSPEVGYLACWKNDEEEYTHSAVITNLNPFKFSNRRCVNAPASNKDSISDLKVFYDSHFPDYNFESQTIEYRIPKKLEKILDEEKGLIKEVKSLPLLDEEKEIKMTNGIKNISLSENLEKAKKLYGTLFKFGRYYNNLFNNFNDSFQGGYFLKVSHPEITVKNKLIKNLDNFSELKIKYEKTLKELNSLGADISNLPSKLNYLEQQN